MTGPLSEQLTFGGVTGFATGYALSRLGRLALLAIGIQVLSLQAMAHRGWVSVHWSVIAADVDPSVRAGHARRQRTVRAGLGAAARAAAAARRNGQAPRQGLVATRAGARRPLRSQPRPIRPPPPLPPVAPRRGGRLGCGVGADGLPRDEGWWAARGQTAAGRRACSLPPLDCGGGGDER